MKKLLTALLLLIFGFGFSQTKVQLEIEKENDANQYKLKLERTINGEKVVTEKTYSSIDEIKNDPDLKDVDLQFFENTGDDFSFTNEDGKNVVVKVNKDVKDGDHDMVFITKGNDDNEVDVKVWTDDDGKTHILKNGKEVEIEGNYEDADNVFVFKSSNDDSEGDHMEVKIWIDDKGEHHVMINGEEKDYDEWKKEHDGDVHFNISTSDDGDEMHTSEFIVKEIHSDTQDGKVKVFITTSSNSEIHVEDVTSEDLKTFSLDDTKELKLEELNFYPNPSNGAFRLQFKGKEKPTLVRITDINGKEIYSEDMRDFEGTYDKEIDLSGTPEGIYLLQVQQGGKAVNKKIVIK